MTTKLEELTDWVAGKEPPRWKIVYIDTAYDIEYDASADLTLLLAVAEAAAALLTGRGPVLRVNGDGYEDIWYECPWCHETAWPGQVFVHSGNCEWGPFQAAIAPLTEEATE